MKHLLCLTTLLLASGCASMGGADCATDAFQLGQRDGRIGASPQADRYAARCNAPVDAEKYQAGWSAGYSQRPIPLW